MTPDGHIPPGVIFISVVNGQPQKRPRGQTHSGYVVTAARIFHLRAIFNKRSTKDSARLNLARWYNRVDETGFKSFNTIAATFYEHSDEILNFYDNRSTNASAESINSKIKAFRAKLHGVNDTKFFIFRLCLIYA